MTRRSKNASPPPANRDVESIELVRALQWSIDMSNAAALVEQHGSAAAAIESMIADAAREVIDTLRTDPGVIVVCGFCQKDGPRVSALLERHYAVNDKLGDMDVLFAARAAVKGARP